MLGDVRIVQREGGIVQLRRVVPFDEAVPDQLGDDGRGDRLRHRGQQEHRVRVDGARLAQFAHAKALGVNHLVLVDDADSHSGHAGSLHGVRDDAVERRRGLVDGRLGEERWDRHDRRFEQRRAHVFRGGRGDEKAKACAPGDGEGGAAKGRRCGQDVWRGEDRHGCLRVLGGANYATGAVAGDSPRSQRSIVGTQADT